MIGKLLGKIAEEAVTAAVDIVTSPVDIAKGVIKGTEKAIDQVAEKFGDD